jgi:hypothetical protein
LPIFGILNGDAALGGCSSMLPFAVRGFFDSLLNTAFIFDGDEGGSRLPFELLALGGGSRNIDMLGCSSSTLDMTSVEPCSADPPAESCLGLSALLNLVHILDGKRGEGLSGVGPDGLPSRKRWRWARVLPQTRTETRKT